MIRRRGAAYQVDITLKKGGRRRKQFLSYADAQAWEATQKAADGQEVTLGTYTPEGLRSVSGRLVPVLWGNTAHAIKVHSHLNEMITIIGDIPASEFSDIHIEKLLAHYRSIGNSNATINRKWASLSKFFRHLHRTRILPFMPHFPRQREPIGRIRFLTREEEERLFHFLKQFNEDEYRLAVFLVDTGARMSEALKLTSHAVDLDQRCVTFWETKANTNRTVYLTQRALEAIKSSSNKSRPFGMINRWTFRDHWMKARELAGLGEDDLVVPHILRHTCASRLVQGGTDLRRVQEWMGHKSMQMTMRYAHLAPRDLEKCVGVLEVGVAERYTQRT